MSATKPTFKTIDFADTLAVVDKFAKEQGVPDLVFPTTPAVELGAQPATSAPEPVTPPPVQSRRVSVQPKPATPAPIKRLAVELPEYLAKAVSDKAHAGDTTIRYVITQALQKAGFFVDAADLKEDRRRGR
jgi:hypothetical protein